MLRFKGILAAFGRKSHYHRSDGVRVLSCAIASGVGASAGAC